ncbi:hypothetical protein LOD99_14949 [Oopsacas minuta]|uniref:mitogen-activated protein kinase kinase n=1 Tax=Oopsacas minuta TaxID=111878 RepID=A0AAV7KDH5_9METZ|nr:hypothetical protein LOD99_14949 [Oopsacas minuta]
MGNCCSRAEDTIKLVANDIVVLNNAEFESGYDKKSKLKKREIRNLFTKEHNTEKDSGVSSVDPATGEYLESTHEENSTKNELGNKPVEQMENEESLDKATPLPFNEVNQNYGFSSPSPIDPKKTFRIGKRTTPLACHFGIPNIGSMSSFENEFSPIVTDKICVNGETYPFLLSDLISEDNCDKLGTGGFGVVTKLTHVPSNVVMAVKRVQIQVDIGLKRELAAMEEGRDKGSRFIVDYYGSLKHNGEVWMAMELMKMSIHEIKLKVYEEKRSSVPEGITWYVCYCICSALDFLKTELHIIHRDVKPSNMLVGANGSVKICDFGISGPLIESKAKTNDIGCRPYMAPERFDPSITHYTIQSDVWSFGISMMEVITGSFPYSKCSSYFEQWNRIATCDPPQLIEENCSQILLDFINPCLNKDSKKRPVFKDLLKYSYFDGFEYETNKVSMVEWMQSLDI